MIGDFVPKFIRLAVHALRYFGLLAHVAFTLFRERLVRHLGNVILRRHQLESMSNPKHRVHCTYPH